jgi:hypothetical protein
MALDYNTMEYRPQEKARFDIIGKTKNAELAEGFKMLVEADEKAGHFAWELTKELPGLQRSPDSRNR